MIQDFFAVAAAAGFVGLWALVLIPLLWGFYQTLTDVVALFS